MPEQEQAKQQLASLATDSGGAISSSGKACDVCPEMVLIPAGSFRMGDLNGVGRDNEKPIHRVHIDTFALGKYEVSVAEFRQFVGATAHKSSSCTVWNGKEWENDSSKSWRSPGYTQKDTHPVTCVSWEGAQAYVQWLSKETGKRYRLPSESEWEYSARAGSTTKYSWGDSIGSNNANCYSCGSQWDNKKTAPAGSFSANSFGLHDMHGNVWEWVEDCYQDSYKKTPANGEPHLGGACSDRVLRGGSWNYLPSYLRSADRNWYTASERYFHSGFRVAQDLEKDADREG